MPTTLLLRLEGPMQSWGNRLGGAQPDRTTPAPSQMGLHPSQVTPTKSGVLGLCAAALGIDRAESVEHLCRLTYGVRVDRAGLPRTEFQTSPHANPSYDRRVDARVYLADASFLAGLQGDAGLLRELYAALRCPHWPLSLGMRPYVPSVPIPSPGGPVPHALATALSLHPWGERVDDAPRYAVEVAARPPAVQAVDYPVWDQPAGPFALRRFTGIEAVTYEGLWGQVFGWTQPQPPSAPRRAASVSTAVRRAQDDTKTSWTEAEARAEGLPLYYAGEWFRRELERLGTLAAMEGAHGYSNQVLSKWAARHGLTLRPRVAVDTEQVRALRAEGRSFGQIAAELGVSKATAIRLAR